MVVDIRISERLAHDPLSDQSGNAVLDQIGVAPVRECMRDALDQADRLVGLRRFRNRANPVYSVSASGACSVSDQVVLKKQLSLIRRPDVAAYGEKNGLGGNLFRLKANMPYG
jgi:hypothetical protein